MAESQEAEDKRDPTDATQEAEEEEPSGPVELATLNAMSLSNLAKAVGNDGMKLAMCLNIPTTTLIRIRLQGLENGWSDDIIIHNMLLYWKLMRATAKDKDLVADLQGALKHIGLSEIADVVGARFNEKLELNLENFPGMVVASPEPEINIESDPKPSGGN